MVTPSIHAVSRDGARFMVILIGLLATVLYDRAILPTSNEVPYAILSGVIVFIIGMVYLVKQKNQ